ncbi:hypothetical protein [Mycolicibacterium sediminis]|uniref:Secreted protein n=1 Tax=Mycolicibacterium sediminis TaxID=1286180 RepID=A0A7I7QMA5_9MYCO|nr:hypothetical protein [Mycolicibacterium sediminis]BBY27127.1 hypothetical protein MSEDJ_12230 [Mycolicibacterium sediminis]
MTRSIRTVIALAGTVFGLTATALAPQAGAAPMRIGNYEVMTDRWNDHSFIWSVMHSCGAPDCGTYMEDPVIAPATDTLNVRAIPRPLKSQAFQQSAFYADGRYTLIVDVPDGVRCVGYNLPSHDVYNWDAASLVGSVASSYQSGCYGMPGSTDTYAFALQRF